MLCPGGFQPSPIASRPFLDLAWPVRSLWPEPRPLFFHMEQEMLRHMQQLRQSVELMERLHQKIFEEMDQTSARTGTFKPISFWDLGGGGFALSLDTQDFSPQELSVKQVGNRLRVSGRTEKKEDHVGSFSSTCQEFSQDLHLPEGVDPAALSCSLVGGRLQIQAPREREASDGKERVVPITITSAWASTSSGGGPEGSSSSGGGPEGSTSSGGGPEGSTSSGGGPEGSSSSGGGPEGSSSSGGGPEGSSSSGGGPEASTSSGGGPEASTSSGGGPEASTSSGGGPEGSSSSGGGPGGL